MNMVSLSIVFSVNTYDFIINKFYEVSKNRNPLYLSYTKNNKKVVYCVDNILIDDKSILFMPRINDDSIYDDLKVEFYKIEFDSIVKFNINSNIELINTDDDVAIISIVKDYENERHIK